MLKETKSMVRARFSNGSLSVVDLNELKGFISGLLLDHRRKKMLQLQKEREQDGKRD